jgi:DNA-binding MarR family transcriptional regulator
MSDTTPLVELVDEIRLQFHAWARLADVLHRDVGVSAPMRAVLEYLERNGPTPVPRIAQRRGVSRQHVQTIVNELLDAGLVDLRDNPAHQRSHLVALTADGRRTVDAVQRSERKALDFALGEVDDRELRSATDVLRRLRADLTRLIDRQESQ